MNSDIFDDIALERNTKEQFGVSIDIKHVIARGIPTSHTTTASVFLSTKNQLYTYISGNAPLTLGDVRTMIRRMGMTADAYLPPKKDGEYFDRVALTKFKDTFPGRTPVNDGDLRFYRLLAPYNPALVRIAGIPEGTIKRFDASDIANWRVAAKYTYTRIKTVER
jgi:hypothetical protein